MSFPFMSLSKAVSAWTFAAMFSMVGMSLAEASCGTRAIVLPVGTRGELVSVLLERHHEEVQAEMLRSGLPAPMPVPCLTCRQNVPLAPVPVPVSPSVSERSQAIDALLLPAATPRCDAMRGFLRDQVGSFELLLDSPPPTPPPIA